MQPTPSPVNTASRPFKTISHQATEVLWVLFFVPEACCCQLLLFQMEQHLLAPVELSITDHSTSCRPTHLPSSLVTEGSPTFAAMASSPSTRPAPSC